MKKRMMAQELQQKRRSFHQDQETSHNDEESIITKPEASMSKQFTTSEANLKVYCSIYS